MSSIRVVLMHRILQRGRNYLKNLYNAVAIGHLGRYFALHSTPLTPKHYLQIVVKKHDIQWSCKCKMLTILTFKAEVLPQDQPYEVPEVAPRNLGQ